MRKGQKRERCDNSRDKGRGDGRMREQGRRGEDETIEFEKKTGRRREKERRRQNREEEDET